MPSITLKQIFRNNKKNILDLCFNIRSWVIGEIDKLQLQNFAGNGVHFYKHENKMKIDTFWFKKYLQQVKDNHSNIIITWTNKQSDVYNNNVRKKIFGDNTNTYEIGDILILKDFYCFDETDETFHTSEQLKITDIALAKKTTTIF